VHAHLVLTTDTNILAQIMHNHDGHRIMDSALLCHVLRVFCTFKQVFE